MYDSSSLHLKQRLSHVRKLRIGRLVGGSESSRGHLSYAASLLLPLTSSLFSPPYLKTSPLMIPKVTAYPVASPQAEAILRRWNLRPIPYTYHLFVNFKPNSKKINWFYKLGLSDELNGNSNLNRRRRLSASRSRIK